MSPSGHRVYVTNTSNASVSVIDSAMNAVLATVPVGNIPEGVAVDPTGARVYVANSGPNSVSVIDTATNTVVATVAVGTTPSKSWPSGRTGRGSSWPIVRVATSR